MTIPESQAKNFAEEYYSASDTNAIERLKDRLNSKLYLFNKDKDKLDFMKVLIQEIHLDIEDHEKRCKTKGCEYRELKAEGLFLIEQEIDAINEYFEFVPKKEDTFSTDDEISLHNKLNDIIDHLKKQDLGQEILFEEIESLKNHFSLGKKTWFQLVKGKMIDVAIEKGVEIAVVQQVFNALADGYGYGVKWLR
jgi:hypothetical protein